MQNFIRDLFICFFVFFAINTLALTHRKIEKIPNTLLPLETEDGLTEGQIAQVFAGKNLRKSEISYIFRTLDKSRKNSVSTDEWSDFHSLFISPFENCDKNSDFQLSKEELSKCELFSTENSEELIFWSLAFFGKKDTEGLSFAEYLLLRRIDTAVKTCAVKKDKMSLLELGCGLNVMSPSLTFSPHDLKRLFELGIKLQKNYEPSLSLVGFGSLAIGVSYFFECTRPIGVSVIKLNDFEKIIARQILPLTFAEINIVESFQLFKELNIVSFTAFFSYYKIYEIAKEGFFLTYEDFSKIFERKDFPSVIESMLSSFISVKDSRFQSHMNNTNSKTKEDSEFFLSSFLQMKESPKNTKENFDTVFNIFG